MNKTSVLIGIAIAALFQTALLGQIVWAQITLLSSPTEVVLKTTPVDPRDIFRGDYVILNYEISSLHTDKMSIPENIKVGDSAYVLLDTSQSIAAPIRVLADAPNTLAENEAVIRGEVYFHDREQQSTRGQSCPDCTNFFISLSIDSYFVPEGTGTDLEKYRDERALGIIVALNDEGDAAIKGLMIDGEKIYDEPLL